MKKRQRRYNLQLFPANQRSEVLKQSIRQVLALILISGSIRVLHPMIAMMQTLSFWFMEQPCMLLDLMALLLELFLPHHYLQLSWYRQVEEKLVFSIFLTSLHQIKALCQSQHKFQLMGKVLYNIAPSSEGVLVNSFGHSFILIVTSIIHK